MHLLDWLIIILPLLLVLTIGIVTQRHMKSVAHFVSGGRVGGRYLLAVAKGEMQAGAVVFVAAWEVFAHAGFVPSWWSWITGPVGLIVAIFGFVIYRFRETRAMTLAQFFEMRYSRNFRSFTGVLGFFAGIINFGIIPAVGARFMVYFLQLPAEMSVGAWTFPTYVPLMGVFLAISLTLTVSGGLITLMVTDCIEGIISQLFYIAIIVGVLCVVSWAETEYIVMWWSVTTAVYVGGAGAAIIGGLYWKKGTTAGAWAAVVSGSVLSGGGILAYKLFGDAFLSEWLRAALSLVGQPELIPIFTLNGVQISFFSTLIAIALYAGVSLLTCRQDFPINKMLHRDELPLDADGKPVIPKKPWTFARVVGIDHNFSRGDKWITGSLFVWSVGWFSVMVIGTSWNLLGQAGWLPWIKPWSNDAWLGFWHVTAIGLPILVTVVTGLWFTWGGIHDIRALFRSLKSYQIDNSDNGTVKDHKPY